MTKRILQSNFLFIFSFLFMPGLSAQVYVKSDATGTGDGSSWENAYTDLGAGIIGATRGSNL